MSTTNERTTTMAYSPLTKEEREDFLQQIGAGIPRALRVQQGNPMNNPVHLDIGAIMKAWNERLYPPAGMIGILIAAQTDLAVGLTGNGKTVSWNGARTFCPEGTVNLASSD